jgi:hypothetical protein
MESNCADLQEQVFLTEPADILEEVSRFLPGTEPAADFRLVEEAFHDTVALFRGMYPGYQASKTGYHDLSHTLSVFLATARLLHGAVLQGREIHRENQLLGLLAALFHDAGLIQPAGDREGTGAKFIVGHEERSIAFMKDYLRRHEFHRRHLEDCAHIIGCTILALSTSRIPFRNEQIRLAGFIVGAADLLAQMADRAYLEKLLFLYREYQEAHITSFQSELDLLKKSESFYRDVALRRLQRELGNVGPLMRPHFRDRLGLDRDFYQEGIDKNLGYLKRILKECEGEYRRMLRRAGIVAHLEKIEREG